MTAFQPGGRSASELVDKPHHDMSPPHLQHGGPFSHQLNTSNPSFSGINSTNRPRIAHRSSADFRHSSTGGGMAGANGNGPMPVPHNRMGNGHGHGANMRGAGFDGPRSPPNNKSEGAHSLVLRAILTRIRHITCPVQILQAGSLSSWQSLPISAFG